MRTRFRLLALLVAAAASVPGVTTDATVPTLPLVSPAPDRVDSASPVVASPPVSPDPPTGATASGAPVVEPALDPSALLAWTRLTAVGPSPREDHTLVVDPDGSGAWLFGGRDGDQAFGDLWRLDLVADTWERVDVPGPRPAKRFGHAAAWIEGVGMVVFGGQAGAAFFDDLWVFDATTRTWAESPGGGQRPAARYGTCAAVGPDGRLWVSHGFTASGRFADTRAWDPATGRWSVQTPRDGRAPVERCLHDCLWSPDGRLLIYGGQTDGVAALGDRWALDPDTRTWSRLRGPDAGRRRLYAVASDGRAAWVFGGLDERDRPRDDLWHWDLVTDTWEQARIAVDTGGPSPRSGATLIVDGVRGRVLLFGGVGSRGAMGDLWQLDQVLEPAPSVGPDGSPVGT